MDSAEIETCRLFAQGKQFVVLEDDEFVSQSLRDLLENMGGKVACFNNAENALLQQGIENADCYIVDYMLDGNVDGANFLIRLRQKLRKPVCAVIVSGDTSTNFMHKVEILDWPVLHKPVKVSQLMSRLFEQYELKH
jgi:two-component system CheB/CheR fusion protein